MPRKGWLAVAALLTSISLWWLADLLRDNETGSNVISFLMTPGWIPFIAIAGLQKSGNDLVNYSALVIAILVNAAAYFLVFMGVDHMIRRLPR